MASHGSASVREVKPHVNQTSRTNTIVNALKRRAQSVLNNRSIDAQIRAIIRYALETNDPWLAQLVSRAEAGESLVNTSDFLQTPDRAVRAHGKASKFKRSQSTREHGEALCVSVVNRLLPGIRKTV